MRNWEVEIETGGEASVTVIEAADLDSATALAGAGVVSVTLQPDTEVEDARARAFAKLAALGLTEQEANALTG